MSPPRARRRLSPDDLARQFADHISASVPKRRVLSFSFATESVFAGRVLGGLIVLVTSAALVTGVALGSIWLHNQASRPALLSGEFSLPTVTSGTPGASVLGVSVEEGLPGLVVPVFSSVASTTESVGSGPVPIPPPGPIATTATLPTSTTVVSVTTTTVSGTTSTSVSTTITQPTTTTSQPTTTTSLAPTTTTTEPTTTTSCHGNGNGNGNCK